VAQAAKDGRERGSGYWRAGWAWIGLVFSGDQLSGASLDDWDRNLHKG
jgi:hypothetical protein